MNSGLFITGTGTDVGKTFVTALLIKKLRDQGLNASYYKAALSGAIETSNGLVPGDADYVNRIAQLNEQPTHMVSYIYKEAVSPHLAAQHEGNPVELSKVLQDYEKISTKYDFVVVEGSGGIICPIRYDETCKLFLEDIIKALRLDTLVVADAGLGTINAIVLTVHYLKQQSIGIKGIIFNNYTASPMQQDNQKMVELITGVPVIGFVAPKGTELIIEPSLLHQLYAKEDLK